jgi:hypothetical protein
VTTEYFLRFFRFNCVMGSWWNAGKERTLKKTFIFLGCALVHIQLPYFLGALSPLEGKEMTLGNKAVLSSYLRKHHRNSLEKCKGMRTKNNSQPSSLLQSFYLA